MRFTFGTRWLDAVGFAAAYAVARGFSVFVFAAVAPPAHAGMGPAPTDGELVVVDSMTWNQLGGRARLGAPLAVYSRHGAPMLDGNGQPDYKRGEDRRGA